MAPPPTYIAESTPLFRGMGMSPTDSIMRHYVPESAYAVMDFGIAWHGSMQRSLGFISSIVELLCPPMGLCLEFGCGTAPVLRACLSSGRACVALDSNEALILTFVLSLLCSEPGGRPRREEASTSTDVMDEGDRPLGGNPFDHL